MSRIDEIRAMVEKGERQYRNLVLEVKEGNEDNYVVEGYATTYNEPYHLYSVTAPDGYRIEVKEEVDRHAFDDADMSDVIMQYDHQGRVFARLSNGTLKLDKDAEKGLLVTADLGGTDIGKQLYQEIKGGYTTKMSFGFTIAQASELREVEGEADETYVYTIEKVGRLFDVSAVSLPQNDFTSIQSVRSLNNGVIDEAVTERLQAHEDKVARAKQVAELREEIRKLLESEE